MAYNVTLMFDDEMVFEPNFFLDLNLSKRPLVCVYCLRHRIEPVIAAFVENAKLQIPHDSPLSDDPDQRISVMNLTKTFHIALGIRSHHRLTNGTFIAAQFLPGDLASIFWKALYFLRYMFAVGILARRIGISIHKYGILSSLKAQFWTTN